MEWTADELQRAADDAFGRARAAGLPECSPNGNRSGILRYACGHEERFDLKPGQKYNRLIFEAQRVCSGCRKTEKQKQQEAAAKRHARAEAYHDHLYAQAMSLAADVDDMDVVEHYCQGNIDRLKGFIAARQGATE